MAKQISMQEMQTLRDKIKLLCFNLAGRKGEECKKVLGFFTCWEKVEEIPFECLLQVHEDFKKEIRAKTALCEEKYKQSKSLEAKCQLYHVALDELLKQSTGMENKGITFANFKRGLAKIVQECELPKECKKTQPKTKPKKSVSKFEKPSEKDILEYCEKQKMMVDPVAFIAFYESKGWMVGKNKMKSWKAALRTWQRREQQEREKAATDTGNTMGRGANIVPIGYMPKQDLLRSYD